jgi:hypothetical protein
MSDLGYSMFDVFQMIPRPIYRWKSFWFGVLVVGFLGWAWVRSLNHFDTMKVWVGESVFRVESLNGELWMDREPLHFFAGWSPEIEIEIGSGESYFSDRQWFPPAAGRFNRGLESRRGFVEDTGSAPDPFADPDEDPEVARAEREELAAMQIEISDYMTWRFAWWFLVLVFLVSWVSFLAWRWRRMRRLAAGSAEPLARSSA